VDDEVRTAVCRGHHWQRRDRAQTAGVVAGVGGKRQPTAKEEKEVSISIT